jgi:hypothetical protein
VPQRVACQILVQLCLMFDEGGARHGIKTTNFAEVYNCVLCGSRPLPLV